MGALRKPWPHIVLASAAVATAVVGVMGTIGSDHPPVRLSEARLLDEGLWSPAGAAPAPRAERLQRSTRDAVHLERGGRVVFPARIPPAAVLEFAVGARPVGSPVHVVVYANGHGINQVAYDETLRVGRSWTDCQADLAETLGADRIEFQIDGGPADVWLAEPLITAPAHDDRPNILVYVVDCLRADHVGAYGYRRPTTPAIDRIASGSVVLEQAFANAAWTLASVGTLFTGVYPHRHGAQTRDGTLRIDLPTVAERLREAGYATAAWTANPVMDATTFGLSRGFDRYELLARGRVWEVDADAALLNNAVLAWLDQNRDRRFFVYLHSLDLHTPYRPRPPFDALFLRPGRDEMGQAMDLYDNELAYNDREIGRLVEWLRKQDLYDNLLLLLTADHGEEFGEHGQVRHGRSLFEGLLHVPLFLKLPGSRGRGWRVSTPVSHLDVAPTLLDFARAAPLEDADGISLRPLLERKRLPARLIFAEQISPRETIYAVRDDRYKYVRQLIPENREYLFDFVHDPGETENLAEVGIERARPLADAIGRFLRVGQKGYHLAFAPPPARVETRLEITAAAPIERAIRLLIEDGDQLRLGAGGRTCEYRFQPRGGERHLLVETAPPGASLALELYRGERLLLRETVQASALSLVSDWADVPGLEDQRDPLVVWYVPAPAPDSRGGLDPELAAQLEVLGYAE
jgi:arylsulfatase A-like enzyme